MKKIILTILSLSAALLLHSQSIETLDKGGVAMGFSVIPADPALLSKGTAGLASASSPAWASFGNPASLPASKEKMAFGLSYTSWTPGSEKGIQAGLSMKIGDKLAFTAGFGRQSGVSFEEFNGIGESLGEFAPSDMRINIGAAYGISNILSAGVNVHYLVSAIASDASLSAISADAAVFGKLNSLNFAAGVRNMGTGVKDSQGNSFPIPASIFAAGEYSLAIGEKMALCANLDASYFLSAGISAGVGAEFSYDGMFFARAGACLGNDILPSFASAGLGAKFFGIGVDMAYILASDALGGSFLASLTYSF